MRTEVRGKVTHGGSS